MHNPLPVKFKMADEAQLFKSGYNSAVVCSISLKFRRFMHYTGLREKMTGETVG